ncbi:hypothetical protein BOSP111201_04740 [Bordetella sputigena]
MSPRPLDKRDDALAVAVELITQASGEFQSGRTAADDYDAVTRRGCRGGRLIS